MTVFLTDPHALRFSSEQNDIDNVLRGLRASVKWREAERTKLADWTPACRDRLRWNLVAHRDGGFIADAFSGLANAQRLWPDDAVFLIEMMIIGRMDSARYREPVALALSSADEAVRCSPVIDLLLSLDAAEDGDFETARAGFVRISVNKDEEIRNYLNYYIDLAALVLKSTNVDNGESVSEREHAVDIYLSHLYAVLDKFSSVESVLRGIVFFNSMGLPSPATCSIRALQAIQDSLTPRGRGSLIFLLVAYQQYESARPHIEECLGRAEFVSCPNFMKAAANCSLALRDPVLERRVLAQWSPPLEHMGGDTLAAVRSKELSARAKAVSANRPLRVFVGLFGQCRSLDSLSGTLSRMEADLAAVLPGGLSLRYGFATWRRSGARVLMGEDSIEFFRQLLPPAAWRLFEPKHGNTGNEVAGIFPNLISSMLSHFGSHSDQDVDGAQLPGLFPGPVTVIIDDEDEIESEVLRAIEPRGMEQVPHLNQFKMWSRIARLRDALADQAAEEGAPFDVCVLMRNDLVYRGGDFASLICKVASKYENDRVFCDHDPHAEYIEGLGDRYIVAATEAAAKIFDGYSEHISLISDQGSGDASIDRLAGHEMMSKILFEAGYSASPVYNVRYTLNRGIFPLKILVDNLVLDLPSLVDPEDRSRVDRIVRELEAVD